MALFKARVAKDTDSPRTVWGRVLYDLREQKEYELHSICVNLDKVSLSGDQFVVMVFDKDIFNKLQNSKELVASFVRLGYNYSVSVVLGESSQDKLNKKIAELQNKLGFKISLKQGE